MKKFLFSMILLGMMLFIADSAAAQNIDPNAQYKIVNTFSGEWKGANLGWDTKAPHPMVSVERDDPVFWKFQPVAGKRNTYKIISLHPGEWYGASLSWDGKEPHPMISLEFDDPVEWRMDPVAGKRDTYKIVNTIPGKWYGASISWDGASPHPMASLEFDDPVEWQIIPGGSVDTRETGFRVMINGIHCLQTDDGGNGTDEPYIEVFVDGKYVAKWGPRPMNEADRSWWEKITDDLDSLTRKAQQEFWLMPGSVYAQNTVTFKFWEEDNGRNNIIDKDDFIGEVSFTSATQDGNAITREFREGNGRWKVVFTKATRTNIDTSVEGASPRIPVRVPILDQGNEGACVAYSTVGALTTSYLNRTKPGNSKEDLFDARELYSHRENPGKEGWKTNLALQWIMKNGIPFKNNRSKKLKIKNYYEYYKDGTVKKVILNSNGVAEYDNSFNENGGNGYNKMRKVLKSGEPLMVEYDVFPDFMAYAGVQGVYGGNVSSVVRAKSGHAVFLVGYVNPGIGGNAFPQWILQNSWGSNFGSGGLCRFAEGAADFDDIMYRIGDIEVVDSNAGQSGTSTTRPTPQATPTPSQPSAAKNNAFLLVGIGNKCLDVNGSNTVNGAKITIWDCHGGPNQQWELTRSGELRGIGNKCLDLKASSTVDGTVVQLWDCVGGDNQKWRITNTGEIRGYGNKCLDVSGSNSDDGTPVILYTCTGNPNQKWQKSNPIAKQNPISNTTPNDSTNPGPPEIRTRRKIVWKVCATDGQPCRFSGTGTVAYGFNAKGGFKYKSNVNGSIECRGEEFGTKSDRKNACYVSLN